MENLVHLIALVAVPLENVLDLRRVSVMLDGVEHIVTASVPKEHMASAALKFARVPMEHLVT